MNYLCMIPIYERLRRIEYLAHTAAEDAYIEYCEYNNQYRIGDIAETEAADELYWEVYQDTKDKLLKEL